MKWHYEVNAGGRLVFEQLYPHDHRLSMVAEECAHDYHSNRDGWDCDWPVDMVIYEYTDNEDGKELWRGTVDREAVPEFRAYTARV